MVEQDVEGAQVFEDLHVIETVHVLKDHDSGFRDLEEVDNFIEVVIEVAPALFSESELGRPGREVANCESTIREPQQKQSD